jgi:hypothetical protein
MSIKPTRRGRTWRRARVQWHCWSSRRTEGSYWAHSSVLPPRQTQKGMATMGRMSMWRSAEVAAAMEDCSLCSSWPSSVR